MCCCRTAAHPLCMFYNAAISSIPLPMHVLRNSPIYDLHNSLIRLDIACVYIKHGCIHFVIGCACFFIRALYWFHIILTSTWPLPMDALQHSHIHLAITFVCYTTQPYPLGYRLCMLCNTIISTSAAYAVQHSPTYIFQHGPMYVIHYIHVHFAIDVSKGVFSKDSTS